MLSIALTVQYQKDYPIKQLTDKTPNSLSLALNPNGQELKEVRKRA